MYEYEDIADIMHVRVPFESLWQELVDSFSHTGTHLYKSRGNLCEMTVVHDRALQGSQAVALELIQLCDASYVRINQSILEKQPVYNDMPSDYDRYTIPRDPRLISFVGLNDALAPFAHSVILSGGRRLLGVREVLDYFGVLSAYTLDTFKATSFTPSPAQITVLLDTCAQFWSGSVGDCFNGIPIRVRQHMARINVRGVTEAIVRQCRELLRKSRSTNILGWFLYGWLFTHAANSLILYDVDRDCVAEELIMASDGNFDAYKGPATPKADFLLQNHGQYTVSREALEMANQIDNLEDVRLVAADKPLDPAEYTDPARGYDKCQVCVICQCELEDDPVVRLRACGHILHLECVRGMINCTLRSSNLCPLDRLKICPRRTVRPTI